MTEVFAPGHGGKRRLVGKLLSLRGVNASNVETIFGLLRPDVTIDRNVVSATLERQLAPLQSIIQLPLLNGGHFDWSVILVQDLLPHCVASRGFGEIFQRALETNPPNRSRPWRLILYIDEITPGNPLRPDNRRKVVAFYASFVELGFFLRMEEAWLTIGVLRTTQIKEIKGGLSGCVRHMLRHLLLGPRSICTGGIAIPLPTPTILHVSFHKLIADEAACKAAWCVKGAAGLRLCMDCKNVVAASVCSHDTSGYLVGIDCADRDKFDPMEEGDLVRSYDILAAMVAENRRRNHIKNYEKASGVNYEPDGLLADEELRPLVPPSSTVRDPMHVMLAGGVLNWEIYALLHAWASCTPGFSYHTLKTFLEADWTWPKSSGSFAKIAEVRHVRVNRSPFKTFYTDHNNALCFFEPQILNRTWNIIVAGSRKCL